MIEAVFWDFGGVLTTSPFEAFNRFERENSLPENFIRSINATNPDTNAWARLERNAVTLEAFDRIFADEAIAAGHEVRGIDVLGLLAGDLRPEMVEALRRCGEHFCNACLTNNIATSEDSSILSMDERAAEARKVMEMFSFIIESSKVGVRKPDPHFYKMACEIVQVSPDKVVFLDDLGINLKPARAMGMSTIKVTDPQKAMAELESILGIPLSA